MRWNYERVHHFRWNVRDAVFLFEREEGGPRFPRGLYQACETLFPAYQPLSNLLHVIRSNDAAANYDVNNVTRAHRCETEFTHGPFLTLKFFLLTEEGRRIARTEISSRHPLPRNRMLRLFLPRFLFRAYFLRAPFSTV